MLELSESPCLVYAWEGCCHWIENTICSINIYAQTLPPLAFFCRRRWLARSLPTSIFPSATIYRIGRVYSHIRAVCTIHMMYVAENQDSSLFSMLFSLIASHFLPTNDNTFTFFSFCIGVCMCWHTTLAIYPSNSIRNLMTWRVLMDVAARYLELDRSFLRSLALSLSLFLPPHSSLLSLFPLLLIPPTLLLFQFRTTRIVNKIQYNSNQLHQNWWKHMTLWPFCGWMANYLSSFLYLFISIDWSEYTYRKRLPIHYSISNTSDMDWINIDVLIYSLSFDVGNNLPLIVYRLP